MRRWLAILVLVFMPLQLGWAAVSAYCQHESGAAAQHLGHHEHQHQAAADDESGAKSGGSDVDCGFCHAACVTAIPSGTDFPAFDITSHVLADSQAYSLSAHAAEPERPNWTIPA
jgi:hypothetical protein